MELTVLIAVIASAFVTGWMLGRNHPKWCASIDRFHNKLKK